MSKKEKKSKKYHKYLAKICNNDDIISCSGSISIGHKIFLGQEQYEKKFPKEIVLKSENDSSFFFGGMGQHQKDHYIGMPQGSEGNIIVVGGNGSGKSAGIAMPTLRTWQGPICVTDVKGELSEYYKKLYQQGLAVRPYIVFDPTETASPSYDPFGWLLEDGEANLLNNIWEITSAILPILPSDNQPFWIETERGVFAAALLHYFNLGLSFSEAVCQIEKAAVSSLCEGLRRSENIQVKLLLGQAADMKEETLAVVDRGLRNKLMLFAADPYISHAFRGTREGAECFSWNDLEKYNVLLRIPANRIEQWSGAINLMYTQLIRHLERRPEQYSVEGQNNTQTLLLMDEFARFGKLEMITAAMSTLRSKNVNICLMVQSVAQLDKIYGEHDRRIIFDNCQYQAILRANDAETQKYICESVGTCIRRQHSVGKQLDNLMNTIGYSKQISEVREWRIFPHELSTLEDILLLSPYGFCRVEKRSPGRFMETLKQLSAPIFNAAMLSAKRAEDAVLPLDNPAVSNEVKFKTNEGAVMLTINERTQKGSKRADAAKQRLCLEQKEAREAQKKMAQRRNYIIGELVSKYFPEVREIEPGTPDENEARFQLVEAFLAVLANDQELVKQIKEQASSRCI